MKNIEPINQIKLFGLDKYFSELVDLDKNDKLQCATMFHKLLWKQFLPFQENLNIAKKNYNAKNVLVTDYLGCDFFKKKTWLAKSC